MSIGKRAMTKLKVIVRVMFEILPKSDESPGQVQFDKIFKHQEFFIISVLKS